MRLARELTTEDTVHMTTWVLVANRTGARIFDRDGYKLRLVRSFQHPSGRETDQDIEAQRSHRTFDKHARGRTHQASPHEHSAEAFAQELANELGRGRTEQGVQRVVLIAEPHFLGLVRLELDGPTAKLVAATIPKDLAGADVDAVQDHLAGVSPL
ncbi:MAG TPA: host attachment protein [Polyangiaceae bacterium]|nr:host attachment protein [Polyangiaceae bacterium]